MLRLIGKMGLGGRDRPWIDDVKVEWCQVLTVDGEGGGHLPSSTGQEKKTDFCLP